MKGQRRIDEMYAFTVVDDDDTEGVIGFHGREGWIPLVGADMAMIERLREIAEEVATGLDKPVRLLKFSVREELEVIQPMERNENADHQRAVADRGGSPRADPGH